jgi:hypothetical protein
MVVGKMGAEKEAEQPQRHAGNLVQGGYVAPVGGSPGAGEAEPDPLPGVAHGAALGDVAGVGER